jgi:hypothetical protein
LVFIVSPNFLSVSHVRALVDFSLGVFPLFSYTLATIAGILFASPGSFTEPCRIGAVDGSPKSWSYPMDVND